MIKGTIKRHLIFIDDGLINNKPLYKAGNIKLDKNPLLLTINFKDEYIIGTAFLSKDKEKVYADITFEVIDERILELLSGAFPAIKGRIIDSKLGKVLELINVSICTNPNTDTRIQPIKRENIIYIKE